MYLSRDGHWRVRPIVLDGRQLLRERKQAHPRAENDWDLAHLLFSPGAFREYPFPCQLLRYAH
jgi:hypothetical protein